MSASAKKKLRKEQNAALLTEKQLKEQKEAKKLKTYTTIFVAAIAVILVVALAITAVTFIKNSGIKEKNTVAAVVGDHEINAVEMGYYYMDTIQNNYNRWYETYGENTNMYITLMGLDLAKPLNEQNYAEDTTWADYFVDVALSSAQSDYLLTDQAKAEGFTMTENTREMLELSYKNMPTYAMMAGFNDVDSYLRAMYGPGANEKTYRAYTERSALAVDYYSAYRENQVIDDAAIRAYEADKFDEFSSFSYASYTINYTHFLTGGTEDENGTVTYSEEEKETARAAAKAAAESLPQCATVEELNAAIAALSLGDSAPANANTYNNVKYTSLSDNVSQWMTDANRKAGDFTVVTNETVSTDENGAEVTTVNSYTAYIFIGRNDNTDPMVNVRHILAAFEGGTTDETGITVYSDEEKAAALAKAEEVLALYNNGEKTEAAFIDLVASNSDDTGSVENGGLIEDIAANSGQYVQPFTDWAVDSARKVGDTGIVETEYGYHVMYFVGQDEMTYRDSMIHSQILEETVSARYEGILAATEINEKDLSTLNMGIVLSQQ